MPRWGNLLKGLTDGDVAPKDLGRPAKAGVKLHEVQRVALVAGDAHQVLVWLQLETAQVSSAIAAERSLAAVGVRKGDLIDETATPHLDGL